MYVLLFSVPFLIVFCQSFLKLSGSAKDATRWRIFLFGCAREGWPPDRDET